MIDVEEGEEAGEWEATTNSKQENSYYEKAASLKCHY